ncbi:MAG TPA: helicase HerA-like domain-containing protein, partial [Vicinamibacteria bacterium]|nr:helicase HerA-like domain-containing protein [Vicinamibacteria bacterium]
MAEGLYLGKEYDPKTRQAGSRIELDPADLVTHGLIVGMTGSGKTGLAIALIEEVLKQGIPVLAIDPKGDLGNLLLLFPDQDAASFEPWIDPDAARRDGQDVKTAAASIAQTWKSGLAEWGLGGDDLKKLKESREAVIFTPGSRAGVPLNILESLEAPSVPFESAEEDLRDEIAGIVAGLLGLLKIDADPLQSKESIFLSNLIEQAWRGGKGLTLEALVSAVADPPFDKVGALPLESVYPRKQREGLMMALNNLLASPAFGAWRVGEPLDIDRMLHTADGKPRLSIVYTAHLSDEERLFVTALLLDKVKTWIRQQSGTSELRALVYMDEVFGYFPPSADPPTKRPLLTLLKQGRAQGVGVVLATQNPVDLDYKGLANMGTWVVGRLQTERDRERLRVGLEGSGGLDGKTIDRLLDATGKRVFLLHDVHRKAPLLLQSRWAMSYLRGPLTPEEISRLMQGRAQAEKTGSTTRGSTTPAATMAPVLPAPLRSQYYDKYQGELADPHLLVKYAVRYKGVSEAVDTRAWPLAGATAAEVLEAEAFEVDEARLAAQGPGGLRYSDLPSFLAISGAKALEKALKERLADKLAVRLLYDPATKASSSPGETAAVFASRLGTAGAPGVEKARDRVEKKRRELELRQQELQGR